MNNVMCMHFYVSGRVQGVWFRANTKKQADQLGLTGWVCNLEDGRVEVMACGEKIKLEILAAWLHKGPDLAVVSQVVAESCPFIDYTTFEIK